MAKRRQSRTREARQRRQKQRRQSQRLYALIGIVVVAVVAIAVVIVSNQPVEAHIPNDLSARYEGIVRSFSPVGYPRLGDNDAPVSIEEYASFACPGCEALHKDSFDVLLERVREGQVRFTYVPLNTGSVPNAEGASRAALCAGVQGKFWEMHDVLFDWQTRYGNTAFSQNRLLAGVEGLGLSSSGFTNCFNSAAINDTLNAAVNEDVSSTPTIRVNGVTLDAGGALPSTTQILQAIDDATPADWGMPAAAPSEEAGVEAEIEPTSESTAAATDESADASTEAEPAETSDTGASASEPAEQPTETPADDAADPTPEGAQNGAAVEEESAEPDS